MGAIKKLSVKQIIKYMEAQGHVVFTNDAKPFNLNIVGIRNADRKVGVFNDSFNVFWWYDGNLNHLKLDFTSEPSIVYMKKPMTSKGTAIMAPGQYRGCYEKGMHRGAYEALVQSLGKVQVFRDTDKDDQYDYDNPTPEYAGLNIHLYSQKYVELERHTNGSAGCQVVQNNHEYWLYMEAVKRSLEYFKNSFTYTLLDEAEF